MNDRGPIIAPSQHNPLNINIQFNINGQPSHHFAHPLSKKGARLCPCHPPRTPDLPNTDRQAYSKDIEDLRPIEATKKKRSKRNSMDINAASLNKSHQQEMDRKKVSQPRSQIAPTQRKPENRKKNTVQKDEPFKKTFQQPGSGTWKSPVIGEGKSQRKILQRSLKSIIHKIVNSELSKRSLVKGKSPYQSHNLSGINVTSRKRTSRKKSSGGRSDRAERAEDVDEGPEIVQKLNSLKSMTNSILRSEGEENEMNYYSKKRGKIHIRTDRSLDLIDEIAYYQRRTARDEQKRETVNKAALSETNRIIESYIQFINENIQQSDLTDLEEENHYHEKKKQLVEKEEEEIQKESPRKIKETLNREMRELFADMSREASQDYSKPAVEVNVREPRPEKQISEGSSDKIRPFLSSEVGRGERLDKVRLQELKQQQIQKWGYLLDFIRKNMGNSEADTETVLNEVYWFLERSKNDLQRGMTADETSEKRPPLDEEFTVKYSERRQVPEKEIPSSEQLDEDIASFKEEYTEQNQDLKMLNLDTISSALHERQRSLERKKDQQINALQQKLQSGKISQDEYRRQKDKLESWTRRQLAEITRARKSIWKGYHEAKGILDKTVSSQYYEQKPGSTRRIMKCLSETYLRRKHPDYSQVLQSHRKRSEDSEPKVSLNSQSASGSQQSQDSQAVPADSHTQSDPYDEDFEEDDENQHIKSIDANGSSQLKRGQSGKLSPSPEKSQEMDAIKERLLRMKREHFTGEEVSSGSISYQQVEKQLEEQYSEQEIAIVNRQVGGSFANNSNFAVEQRLRYCCSQDKQDIFQFIFLDLCIELYQEPCRQNRIMKSINAHVAKVQAQAKKKKGVKTSLNVVKEYLKRFVSYLLRTNRTCLSALASPMGPTALEMLRYMHEGDYDIRQQQEEAPTLVIPITIFQKFQQSLLPTLEFEQYYDDPDKEEARIGFLKTILHIHNKALFDSLNEFLDHERPFGIWGKPFPWKRSSSFSHDYSEASREQKLRKSMDKVIQQCSYVCGLLVDKQESLVGNAKISEAYVQQIREDRLSRMLANQLVQSEQRWLFYDDEQTEVLVEISSYVWNMLLQEVKTEVGFLQKRF